MGVIAESIAEYAQPLLDQTDGSAEDVNRAFSIAQICWNLAVMPEESRAEVIADMQATFKMDDGEFNEFQSIVDPMIQRHYDMFPHMPRLGSKVQPTGASASLTHPSTPRIEKFPGTGRNRPCPCNSGKKYKMCCGR